MLTRLASVFLSVSLLSSVAADARRFAQPPQASEPIAADPAAMPMPMPVLAPTRAQVKKALAARRDKNLAAFRAYRKAGVYPHNFVRTGPLNVWIDRDGHLCAAATMIDKDGKHELVMKVGAENNQIRLLDVIDGPLLDWMLTSGFTIEEIDRIQMPGWQPNVEIQKDPTWLAREDARLRAGYAATDAWLVKHKKASLDEAVTRLLERPELARKLVDGPL